MIFRKLSTRTVFQKASVPLLEFKIHEYKNVSKIEKNVIQFEIFFCLFDFYQ